MATPIRVLIVDDHQILRESVRSLLSRDAAEPAIVVAAEAANGADALTALREVKLDVAVLDLAIPEVLGIDVCRAAIAQGVKVVILTMHLSTEHVRLAREAGASGYVVKGSGVSQLASTIRQVAAGATGIFPDAGDDRLSTLSGRQREILIAVAQGLSSREIAEKLGLSPHTVNTHRIHLMDKLNVHDAIGLARLAMTFGLVP